ncbi:General secretion pathway protein J [Pseudomonas chlororaphis]|uniref:General secretion pathway protein J n=1 Tax=Pseudomonas chlororaphis TaxID=587753 RepID=A0A3G7TNU5_9PSED|nr:General secretion pathway protein J [Pseudomonas chlororaphis]
MRARTNQRQGGFTLIEVMVAILLMAVVSVIAWRGLDSVSRADSHLQASSEQTEELLRTLHQLERDVALRASVELMEPVPAGADAEAEAVDVPAALTVRSADSGTLRLDVIRSSATPGEGLQRVRWWLKGDTLYRAAAPARDRYPLPAPKTAWQCWSTSATCSCGSGIGTRAGASSAATARKTRQAWRSAWCGRHPRAKSVIARCWGRWNDYRVELDAAPVAAAEPARLRTAAQRP